jgi:hypothetical protein
MRWSHHPLDQVTEPDHHGELGELDATDQHHAVSNPELAASACNARDGAAVLVVGTPTVCRL